MLKKYICDAFDVYVSPYWLFLFKEDVYTSLHRVMVLVYYNMLYAGIARRKYRGNLGKIFYNFF